LGLALAAAAWTAVGWASSSGARPHTLAQAPPGLDHFTCYKVRQVGRTTNFSVLLADQFETATALTVRTLSFCAPTSKNGSQVLNPVDHLSCRQIAQPGSFVPRTVLVTNQFGTITLRVFARWSLCAPALKSFTPTFPGPPTVRIDHFKCYVARLEGLFRPRPVVTIANQFETAVVNVRKPVQLCTPVAKTVGTVTTPITNTTAHLACYELMPRLAPIGPFTVFTSTQFGVQQLVVGQRDTLCLPSTKTVVP
jgi:hypothetical protein